MAPYCSFDVRRRTPLLGIKEIRGKTSPYQAIQAINNTIEGSYRRIFPWSGGKNNPKSNRFHEANGIILRLKVSRHHA